MMDKYSRNIDYLRISITDRCNLRCKYCSPGTAFEMFSMQEILTYEEIERICKEAAKLGIKKLRLTGGEPLVRKDVAVLVRMLKKIPGIEEVNITTNGVLLKDNLGKLLDSGIDAVNVSLDVSDAEKYKNITGVDSYEQVREGILAAYNAGIHVKLNTVLINDEDYKTMFSWAKEYPIDVRFIELMPLGAARELKGPSHEEVLKYIDQAFGGSVTDESIHGNGPARYYRIPEFKGAIGLISPINDIFCQNCNKIRLTATGLVKPCLCYENAFDIKTPLRDNNIDEVVKVLKRGILEKPEAHSFNDVDKVTEEKRMVSIGG